MSGDFFKNLEGSFEIFNFGDSILISFINDDQGFHSITIYKFSAGSNGILYFFDDSAEMEGLLRIGFFFIHDLDLFEFVGDDFFGELLVGREKGFAIDMFDDLIENKYEINSLIIVRVVFH